MGTIFTSPRHTSASGVARIHVLNNNNITIFRDNSRYENMNMNEEIPPKYTDLYNINDNNTYISNANTHGLGDCLILDNGLPRY